jgi:hypothetical protein
MSTLFYYTSIIFIMAEFVTISSPKKIHQGVAEIKKRKPDTMTLNMKLYVFVGLFYLVWALVGLFSSQYICFVALLILSFMPKKHWIIRWVDAVLSLFILIFLILNYAHWHIDLSQIITQLFTPKK